MTRIPEMYTRKDYLRHQRVERRRRKRSSYWLEVIALLGFALAIVKMWMGL